MRNIRDKETFLESGIIASLLDYLSKLNETDFGELIQYADFSGEKVDIDMLPPEYHEDINKIVKNFSDEEIKVESLNWIATFISEMINATPDPNCSWPGDVHALILSKLIQTNIVMVDNLLKGLHPSFDTSGYLGMFNLVILSAAAQIGRKNCYLFRYNSDYSNFHCHWNEYKNHFVYMKEILDKTESDDEWKNAYTGRGGIPDDRCNPFTPDASVSLSDQEGSEQNISLDDVKSSESNAEMQVDNTTPATITSKVTCCAAGDLCTAPMGTKISFLKCYVCKKQMHSIEQCGIELDLTDSSLITSSLFKNNSFTSEDTKQFILCFKCQRELPNDLQNIVGSSEAEQIISQTPLKKKFGT